MAACLKQRKSFQNGGVHTVCHHSYVSSITCNLHLNLGPSKLWFYNLGSKDRGLSALTCSCFPLWSSALTEFVPIELAQLEATACSLFWQVLPVVTNYIRRATSIVYVLTFVILLKCLFPWCVGAAYNGSRLSCSWNTFGVACNEGCLKIE